MKRITIEEIIAAVGGKFFGDENLLTQFISGVKIDSRKIKPNDLFVTITGDRFDGSEFAGAAYDAGALAVLTDRKISGIPYILTDNSIKAFHRLAGYYRDLFDIPVIGITGSNGKTTTKEMVSSVFSQKYNVHKTLGNLNNQTGVPQVIFGIEPDTQAAVVEMGTNNFGEIASLAKIVKPDYGIITNIGDAHIENFKTREGTLKAKAEMIEYIKPGGTLFINGDDEYLITLKSIFPRVYTFGFQPHNDLRATKIIGENMSKITAAVETDKFGFELEIPSPGRHMVYNALAAAAAGLAHGIEPQLINKGIAEYKPTGARLNITEANGYTVINDAYNANPTSMRVAIDVLAQVRGRKIAVLGDMLELGDKSKQFHFDLGAYAAEKGVDLVIGVGELSANTYRGAIEFGGDAQWYLSVQELEKDILNILKPDDTILVKASNGMKLYSLADYLTEERN